MLGSASIILRGGRAFDRRAVGLDAAGRGAATSTVSPNVADLQLDGDANGLRGRDRRCRSA